LRVSLLAFHFSDLIRHADLDRALCGVNGRQFQNRNKFFWLAIRLAVAALGLRVIHKLKDFNIPFPRGLSAKQFMHGHRFDMP
jgi:hypothetical protein